MDFAAGRHSWDKLYRLLRQLPRHSHFYAALLDDDETAAQLAEQPTAERFGFRDWTFERELLTRILAEIRALLGVTIAANSRNGKAPNLDPVPWPETAVDRRARRSAIDRHRDLVSKVLPHTRR